MASSVSISCRCRARAGTAAYRWLGENNGSVLATAVSRVEIVKADGTLGVFTRVQNPDIFPGLVVGLGATGIVSSITLGRGAVVQEVSHSMSIWISLS